MAKTAGWQSAEQGFEAPRVHKEIMKKILKGIFFYPLFLSWVIFLFFFILKDISNKNISPLIKQKNSPIKLIESELKLGSKGEEVKLLQAILSTDSQVYPQKIISGYYGNLTRQAVINFQKKYHLLPTGIVDLKTADKINKIFGNKTKDYYLSLIPHEEVVYQDRNQPEQQNFPEEWGVAKQISEKTWTMKVGFDEKMATPEEIFQALNVYRQRHGKNSLQWDERLAGFALERAKYFTQIGRLDEHKGFEGYVGDIENLKKLGFWRLGENSSFGYRLEGVHLIEWVFAGDEPHNKNQLDPEWTHVGIGVDGYQVDIIFGAYPIN